MLGELWSREVGFTVLCVERGVEPVLRNRLTAPKFIYLVIIGDKLCTCMFMVTIFTMQLPTSDLRSVGESTRPMNLGAEL